VVRGVKYKGAVQLEDGGVKSIYKKGMYIEFYCNILPQKKMDTQQMLELLLARMDADREERKTDKQDLLAKMDADQEKAEADRKANKEERKAAQEKAEADRAQTQQMMKILQAAITGDICKVYKCTSEVQ
jgi:hypothetical protein